MGKSTVKVSVLAQRIRKLYVVSFLLFAMPLSVFSQSQDVLCYTTSEQAENYVQHRKNLCIEKYGDGTIADIMVNFAEKR